MVKTLSKNTSTHVKDLDFHIGIHASREMLALNEYPIALCLNLAFPGL
jgi:hypothetical protein